MHVQNATLKALVQGEKQFRVPIWQRQYTWGVSQHEQMWHDLVKQYDALVGGHAAVAGHFLGSFVLSPFDPTAAGVQTFLVIDGQQRLTTLTLILCALRDVAAETEPHLVDRFDKLYLINEFQQGPPRFRLQPTEEDRKAYQARVERSGQADAQDLITDAYRFYAQRLREPRPGGNPIDATAFERVIAERMAIVEITTEPGDNAHRIFQSINGTGVDLNQADLLRNYIFMLLPTEAEVVYEQVWRPMEMTVGVDNLAGLARVDLQRRGQNVATSDVYAAHQRLLDPMTHDERKVRAWVEDFALRGRHYKRLIDPPSEPDVELSAGLGRLARWGAQTSYPVLMVGYDLHEREIIDSAELRRVVAIIESFLVRRQLARIATNSLSKLFVQIIDRLPDGEGFADGLHRELSRERLDWPDDEWIRKAVKTQRFFHIGRWDQRKMILERLERSFDHPEKLDFNESALQIEHILPQTLSAEWREHLTSLGQDPDEVHSQLVHTLGNLTLTAFNGKLSNNPFERKLEIYGESHLELNRALQENKSWGLDEILARAETLASQICEIWMSPLPDVKDASVGGFDWTRIEAAIAAVPLGRWTAYSDLAELGGTAAQAVGTFVANKYHGAGGYRVLTVDGTITPLFHWDDPNDDRDVRELLVAEGIQFDDDRADPAQRMTSDELANLVDVGDEDELLLDTSA
jgi:alkylated DNA nucleotide flippase Atl1